MKKGLIGNIVAIIYFIMPLSIILLVFILMPLLFVSEVSTMTESGFSGPDTGAFVTIGIVGFFISISLLIPVLRRIYRILPWLYPFIKIFFINFIILNIGHVILNIGYQVQSSTRHITFFILMIVQIVVCRIAMCIYFKLKPVRYIEER